ncbi:adenylate cyclase-like protein [Leptomonas pyrrhocoris]|uniref:Adenylate cyclase-like protein n=1 Tax=Leptomonas pyrrhocoris TaxID=157538 RepID=A0A0M9FYU4_LEPPY|nr:adenylate cyclase-like protein [Leptomonas pyrrhocoris]KPA78885.1 adenylate cyclase-like protein [Leptomonas pyrrhocoris]|eukprot:XP_015657324.1 adenylate cyclase-like protein [Leptomonas pyrrhocoris]
MGVAVSTSISGLPTRRRFSRWSLGSRTSLGSNSILVGSPSEHPSPSPLQHRLCDLPSSKSDAHSSATTNTTSAFTTADADAMTTTTTTTTPKETVRETSPHILCDCRVNSNTVNSIHTIPWGTLTEMRPFDDSTVTCRADAPQRNPLEINASDHRAAKREEAEAVREALRTDIDVSVTCSAPRTAMRHGSPKLHISRCLRWADMAAADEATDRADAAAASSTPTMPFPAPSGVSPLGHRRTFSLSSTDCADLSKAVIATSKFKASHQRLCKESRSLGHGTAVDHNIQNNIWSRQSYREECRTSSTQLSTEEWSHLFEHVDATDNMLITAEDELQRSHGKPKVAPLPQYPPTDTAPVVDPQPPHYPRSPSLQPNTSITTNDVGFTPLRMTFSTTSSLLSGPPNPEIDLQRAITAVDAHAANMRRLLTSWQDIANHHLDAFARALDVALAAQQPVCGCRFSADLSPEEDARRTLGIVGQAVHLVSQMENMFAALLEMGAMHRRYDVGADHFEAMHRAFMQVLPDYVAADQRESLCEVVWEPFWQLVVRLLSQGYRSERGEWYAAQRRAEWLADARAVLEAVAEQEQCVGYRGTFVPAMLDRAEAVNPAMSQFAPMREPRIATRCFEKLTFIALEVDDDTARACYIEQLAHEHIIYGLSECGLRALRQPFIDTCRFYATLRGRAEVWTATAAESLGLFWDMLTQHWVEGITVSRWSLADITRLRAPSGSHPFCMMFTDIEAGSRLWELYPSTMADAVDAHNRLLRRLIAEHGAYEVKTDGDTFVIATRDVFSALQIAVSTQLELMRGPIVEGFRMIPGAQGGGLGSCWREDSLRVRIGIHFCTDASAVYDSVQRRFDYYGPGVNCAARTAATAAGGQILLTQSAMNALRVARRTPEESPMPLAEMPRGCNAMDVVLDSLVEFQRWGEQRFRGVSESVRLYSVLPMRLSGRAFPYYVGSRKVRVSAPSDVDGRREVYRLSLSQLKSGDVDESTQALFSVMMR